MRDPDEGSRALEALLDRFGQMVRAVGGRHGLSRNDLDEVVQDVRIRLWHTLERFENPGQINASYVYRAAASAALDLIRRRSRREIPMDLGNDHHEVDWAATDSPDQTLEDKELAQQVFAAVETLSEARRPVVRMHLAGYHRNEIADLLGWSEAKTRNLLYRGLHDLRQTLTKAGVVVERP